MTVAKVVELSATSPNGFDAAAKEGLERARKSLDGVKGAWIKEQRIEMGDDGNPIYRVNMNVTFLMRD